MISCSRHDNQNMLTSEHVTVYRLIFDPGSDLKSDPWSRYLPLSSYYRSYPGNQPAPLAPAMLITACFNIYYPLQSKPSRPILISEMRMVFNQLVPDLVFVFQGNTPCIRKICKKTHVRANITLVSTFLAVFLQGLT